MSTNCDAVRLIDVPAAAEETVLAVIQALGFDRLPDDADPERAVRDADEGRCCLVTSLGGRHSVPLRRLPECGYSACKQPIVMIAAGGGVRQAVEGMRRGVVNVLEQPVNPEDFRASLCEAARAAAVRRLKTDLDHERRR